MAGARGVVEATVAGVKRRLRLSLQAMDDIETDMGMSFEAAFASLTNPETVRVRTFIIVFRALCAAGGTPLSEEDEAALMPSDLPAIIAALEALDAAVRTEEGVDDRPTKKKGTASRAKPRGAAGKK